MHHLIKGKETGGLVCHRQVVARVRVRKRLGHRFMQRRGNHYVWHRSSHFGPQWYEYMLAGLTGVGAIAMAYGLVAAYLTGFWTGVMVLWVLSPILAGSYVGLAGVRAGGLPALVGFAFLVGNFALSAGLYLGEGGTSLVLLMGPFIHLAGVVGMAALLAAMGRNRR